MTQYFGRTCLVHPELNGLRRTNNRSCVACDREKTRLRNNARRAADPSLREKRARAEYVRNKSNGQINQRIYRQNLGNRIPPWADKNKINEFYIIARKSGLTVDHIIPLKGKLVSGLHVHDNLQLLPASVNSSKGNDFPIKEKL